MEADHLGKVNSEKETIIRMELPEPEASVPSKKYTHLHEYKDTGRYGAWIKGNGGDRVFLGTHKSRYLAARCQDRALLKLKQSAGGDTTPVQLNFDEEDYADDELLRKIHSDDEFINILKLESRGAYRKAEASPCLEKFMQHEAQGLVTEIELQASQRDHQHQKIAKRGHEGEPSEVASDISESPSKAQRKEEVSEPSKENLLDSLEEMTVLGNAPKRPRTSSNRLKAARDKQAMIELLDNRPAEQMLNVASTSTATPSRTREYNLQNPPNFDSSSNDIDLYNLLLLASVCEDAR